MKPWAMPVLILLLISAHSVVAEDESGGWLGKAVSFYSEGSYELAILYVNKSLDIDPAYPDAWNLRGYIQSDLGRYREAADSFNRSLAIDPSDPHIWYSQGFALSSLGEYDEAVGAQLLAAGLLAGEGVRPLPSGEV
jgi:tetratricopeptide (TPR) repeat protein